MVKSCIPAFITEWIMALTESLQLTMALTESQQPQDRKSVLGESLDTLDKELRYFGRGLDLVEASLVQVREALWSGIILACR